MKSKAKATYTVALRQNEQRQLAELHRIYALICQIDEAMATPERIAFDTQHVGGFVSSLDITETAEEILERALSCLNKQRECSQCRS